MGFLKAVAPVERRDERDGTHRPRAKLGEQARVWLTAFTLSLLIHALLFGLFAWMFPEPPGVWLGGFLGFPFSRVEENGAYVWLLAPAESAPAPELESPPGPLPSEAFPLPSPPVVPREPAAPWRPSRPRPVPARPEPAVHRPPSPADGAQQTVEQATAPDQQAPFQLSMPQVHPSPAVPVARPRPQASASTRGPEQPPANAEDENRAKETRRFEERAAERSKVEGPAPEPPPGLQRDAAGEPDPSPSQVALAPPQPALPLPAQQRPAQAAESGALLEPEPHTAGEAAPGVEAAAVEEPSHEVASSREAAFQASSAQQDGAAGPPGPRVPLETAASGKPTETVEPGRPGASTESRAPGKPDEPAKPVESKEAWEAKESGGPKEASEPKKPGEPAEPKEPGEPRESKEPETLKATLSSDQAVRAKSALGEDQEPATGPASPGESIPPETPAAAGAALPFQPDAATPAAFHGSEALGSTLQEEVVVETEPTVMAPSSSAAEMIEPHPAQQAIAPLPLETSLGLRRALTWTPPAPITQPEPEDEAQPDDTPPRVLERVAPVYPALARRLAIEGSVTLQLVLDAEGVPQEARVTQSSGRADLDTAAREAALQWRFEPARRGGQPVPSEVKVVIEFRLID